MVRQTNSNCDQTQKLKLRQNSTQILKLLKNLYSDKTKNIMFLQNLNSDQAQKLIF